MASPVARRHLPQGQGGRPHRLGRGDNHGCGQHRRPARGPPRPIRAGQRRLQIRPEQLEIDHNRQPLSRSPAADNAFNRSSAIKEPGCPAITAPRLPSDKLNRPGS